MSGRRCKKYLEELTADDGSVTMIILLLQNGQNGTLDSFLDNVLLDQLESTFGRQIRSNSVYPLALIDTHIVTCLDGLAEAFDLSRHTFHPVESVEIRGIGRNSLQQSHGLMWCVVLVTHVGDCTMLLVGLEDPKVVQ
jgi:hypothetical protein